MPAIQKKGDSNSGGGVITGTSNSSVYADGRLVATSGDNISSHSCCGVAPPCAPHCAAVVVASSSVIVEGIPASKRGDSDSCGHSRISDSTVSIS